MRDPNQKRRFNNEELAYVKALFADNEELVYTLRKVFLQAPLSEQEEVAIKKLINPKSYALIKKFFLPELDKDAPFFQMADLYIALGSEVKGYEPEIAWPFIRAKKLVIKYLEQQLNALLDVSSVAKPEIVLEDLTIIPDKVTTQGKEDVWVNINTYNHLLSFIDTHANEIKDLAGRKDETPEETIERLKKNSTK
jgi:hypothetical protein